MYVPVAEYKNSAGRLLNILDLISERGRKQNYLQTIPSVFDIKVSGDNVDQAEVVEEFLYQVRELYQEFLSDLKASDLQETQQNVIIGATRGVRRLLYPLNLGENVPAFDSGTREMLKFAAVSLRDEDGIVPEDVNRIREMLHKIQEFIGKSELQKSARQLLMDLVRIAEDSLRRYEIHGARAMKDAVKVMLGELMSFYATEGSTDDPKSSPFWKKGMELLSLIDSIASRVLKYKPLIEGAGPLFLN